MTNLERRLNNISREESTRSREEELEECAERLLDMMTNLTKIPTAKEVSDLAKKTRKVLRKGKKKNLIAWEKKFNQVYHFSWLNLNVTCKRIEVFPSMIGNTAGINVHLTEADVVAVLSDICEMYGDKILIDFANNG